MQTLDQTDKNLVGDARFFASASATKTESLVASEHRRVGVTHADVSAAAVADVTLSFLPDGEHETSQRHRNIQRGNSSDSRYKCYKKICVRNLPIFVTTKVSLTGKLFQPSLMFVGKARTDPSEAPFR